VAPTPATDASADSSPAPRTLVETAMSYLVGSFDSADQAKEDRQYHTVYLSQCEISLPELGEHVLYVEQAISKKSPYRQRIYLVEAGEPKETRFVNRIFQHKDETKLVNLCDDPTRIEIKVSDLTEKTGCEVTLEWTGDRFKGGTTGKGCSAFGWGNATYMTSEAELDDKMLVSWDRGFDASGTQVEGARKGPYKFVRRSPFAGR
jgi:hypothetical protein